MCVLKCVCVLCQGQFAGNFRFSSVCYCSLPLPLHIWHRHTHTHSQPVREHALKPQEAKLVRQTGSCHQQLSSPAYQVEATKQSIAMKDNEIAADMEKGREVELWGRGSAY